MRAIHTTTFMLQGDWENVIDIKDKLEDDLKEYVAEIIEPMQQNAYCKNMDK